MPGAQVGQSSLEAAGYSTARATARDAATSTGFSLTSSGTPSIALSPDTEFPLPSGPVDVAGSTNVITQAAEVSSGFGSGSGYVFVVECNDDPGQPTFAWGDSFLSGTPIPAIPVSCHISTQQTIPTTFTIISGNTGYQNGSSCSVMAGTCDSLGNPPAVDAASYPCPPTPSQQSEGDLCGALVLAIGSGQGLVSGLAVQPLEWTGEAEPTLGVSGTAPGKAYPGEVVTLTGNGWPIVPIFNNLSGPLVVNKSLSVCDSSGCTVPSQISQPASGYLSTSPGSIFSTAQLDDSAAIPASASGGVTFPCVTGCWVSVNATASVTEEGFSATIAASVSAPINLDPSLEPAPTVTGVDPPIGLPSGGSVVTVTGTAFTGATQVLFCTAGAKPPCTPGTGITVVNDDRLTVNAPAGNLGPVDVEVTNPAGTSTPSSGDTFTYVSTLPLPVVSGVNPTGGSAWGGDTVTITGTNFFPGATVDFGSKPATEVNVVSDTEITCTAPPLPGGNPPPLPFPTLTPTIDPTTTATTTPSTPTTGTTMPPPTSTPTTGPMTVTSVDVTVTTEAGISALSPADSYLYYGGVFEGGGGLGGTIPGGQGTSVTTTTLPGGGPINGTAGSTGTVFHGGGFILASPAGGVEVSQGIANQGSLVSKKIVPMAPVVSQALTPDNGGYWLVSADGAVFTFGDAGYFGSCTQTGSGCSPLAAPIVGMAATLNGKGYWLVASDGGIFTFGNARFFGSEGSKPLNRPIAGMAATQDSKGYWLVASDGGIFTFGNARFYGSAITKSPNSPVIGMAATPNGKGYWLASADGGIFTFGDARFYGSAGSMTLGTSVAGIFATSDGQGYWLVGSDGESFGCGDATGPASFGS